jgi:hypothetical protein
VRVSTDPRGVALTAAIRSEKLKEQQEQTEFLQKWGAMREGGGRTADSTAQQDNMFIWKDAFDSAAPPSGGPRLSMMRFGSVVESVAVSVGAG